MKKISQYAKECGLSYRTIWNRCKEGIIPYHKDIKGNIFILDKITKMNDAIIYARVSNNNRKESLSEQQKFLETYASSKDYNIVGSFKELASGMNDDRKILSSILNRDDWNILIVENKDRLTRFGFNYIKTLLEKNNKRIEVVNLTDDDKHDIMTDLVSIIYSFSARIYGKRKAKRKEQITNFLTEK